MKANEFVQTHGIKVVSDIVKHYGSHTHVTDDARMFITEGFYKRTRSDYIDDLNSMVKMPDLKRIVESHEIVESHGGLDGITKWIESDGLSALNADFNRAIQARADVESCQ